MTPCSGPEKDFILSLLCSLKISHWHMYKHLKHCERVPWVAKLKGEKKSSLAVREKLVCALLGG